MPILHFDTEAWMRDKELQSCSPHLRGILINLMCLAHSGNPYGTLTNAEGKLLDEHFVAEKVSLSHKDWLIVYDTLMVKRRIALDPLTDSICIPKMLRDGRPCTDPILDQKADFEVSHFGKDPLECPTTGDQGGGGHSDTPPAMIGTKAVKSVGKVVASGRGKATEFEIPNPFPVKLKEAWALWIEFRRRILRCPVSFAAASLQQRMLAKYDEETACNIIERSMLNDWRGLFPPKGGNYGYQKQRCAEKDRGEFPEPVKRLPIKSFYI